MNGGFQNQGVCLQAFPSFPPPPPPPLPPSYFCSRPIFRAGKTSKTLFVALCPTETLTMQAKLRPAQEPIRFQDLLNTAPSQNSVRT